MFIICIDKVYGVINIYIQIYIICVRVLIRGIYRVPDRRISACSTWPFITWSARRMRYTGTPHPYLALVLLNLICRQTYQ